ncbi:MULTISPECIES: phosphotransferase family protein [Mycobacterium]|uniref:Phosphotransferase n=2 Tax=Mycobacterium kiyosense TaxID=2871094 RepID=A0A9P3UW39_9MYCO|nr:MULTISPECIES: phosphotransferase family protein [Mycobacterium]BDB44209.1 putative phosphotransferase [Mycobacterium kiyosense]BDE15745.1 putative phosphotransferase [Mycobacterium sp. 20KCMC460]GLB80862.1 putative phosphotransferase [Mycobacterium kiyosense]GLB87400.1 putative phosphotransferase [Mycobacterium kiyosense]GLB93342.1 putative phosphotransferase [Mycobacterium kiyosense]
MALVSNIDPALATESLAGWLAGRLPAGADPVITNLRVPKESGLSAETVMFDAEWTQDGVRSARPLVARVAPTGPGIYMDYDVLREARVLRAVAEHSSVPVPEVLWSEGDTSVLGAQFLVMTHLDGRVPRDDPPFTAEGWVLDLTPGEQATMYDNSLAAMAAVHAIDVDATGLRSAFARPDLGDTLVAQHVGYVASMVDWACGGRPNPVIDAGLAWLRANQPAEPDRSCLCWGDGRLGNVMFADDLSVAAVLDWEAATVAVPEYDLGWWRFAMRHHSDGMGLPLPPGFPPDDEVSARFAAISGQNLADVEFWEILNGVRFCCIVARGASLMIAGGLLPPDAPMAVNNPGTRVLADILGIPAPTGQSAYYVGNR